MLSFLLSVRNFSTLLLQHLIARYHPILSTSRYPVWTNNIIWQLQCYLGELVLLWLNYGKKVRFWMKQYTNLRLEKLKQILVSSLPLLLAKYIKMLKLLSIGIVSVEKYRYRYPKKIPIFTDTDTDTDPPSLKFINIFFNLLHHVFFIPF